jgi:cytochrome P450
MASRCRYRIISLRSSCWWWPATQTTRNSISGRALALAQHAAERRKWVDRPSLIPRAVNEIIRSVHLGIYARRTAYTYTRRTAYT